MSPVTVMEVHRSSGHAGPLPGVGFGAGVRVGAGVSVAGAEAALLRSWSSVSAMTPQALNVTARARTVSPIAALRGRDTASEDVIFPMDFILRLKQRGTGRAALEDTFLT